MAVCAGQPSIEIARTAAKSTKRIVSFSVHIRGWIAWRGTAGSTKGFVPVSCHSSYAIPQHADVLNFEFHHIATLYPAVQFKATTSSDRAGTDNVAGLDEIVLCQKLDHLLEAPEHIF